MSGKEKKTRYMATHAEVKQGWTQGSFYFLYAIATRLPPVRYSIGFFSKKCLVDRHFLYESLTKGHSSLLIDSGDRGEFSGNFLGCPFALQGRSSPETLFWVKALYQYNKSPLSYMIRSRLLPALKPIIPSLNSCAFAFPNLHRRAINNQPTNTIPSMLRQQGCACIV